MSVLRFLLTRQALTALARRPAESSLQNCRTLASLAGVNSISSSNNNKSLFATTTATTAGGATYSLQLQTTRGHKRFGHQTEPTPRITRFFHFFVLTLFFISVLDWGK